jgi:hypothetical protein
MTEYVARFATDGSGDWTIQLAANCDAWDLQALGPVVDAVKAFVAPTIEQP